MTADRYRYQNPSVLGTVVEFSFRVSRSESPVDPDELADRAAGSLFDEIDRLQAVFSAFDPDSELSRWRRGDTDPADTSDEFAGLMGEALWWQRRTNGLFNPLAGVLTARWVEAASEGRRPDPDEMAALADTIAEPRFEIVDGRPIPCGDCSQLNLNAMAKGHIVDRSLTLVADRFPPLDDLLVNAGGDLCHRGRGRMKVGIENPLRPYDNEPPLVVIEIANEAVATSGAGRRGFDVGPHRVSHVLDPRTGMAADASASATVVAPSAGVADVVATPLAILEPAEAISVLDELAESIPLAALIVGHDGDRHASRGWRGRFGTTP